jgi:hypothetical protein
MRIMWRTGYLHLFLSPGGTSTLSFKAEPWPVGPEDRVERRPTRERKEVDVPAVVSQAWYFPFLHAWDIYRWCSLSQLRLTKEREQERFPGPGSQPLFLHGG